MAWGNPVVGGTVLRTAAIQSPNFVQGVSGWAIEQNGSAFFAGLELTSGLIVLTTSAPPPASGLFVYDSSGVLIGSIAAANGTGPDGGTARQGFTAVQDNAGAQGIFASLNAGVLQLGSLNPSSEIVSNGAVQLADALTAAARPHLVLGSPVAGFGASQLILYGASADGTGLPEADVVIAGTTVARFLQAVTDILTGLSVTGGTATDTLTVTAGASVTGGAATDTLTVTGASAIEGTATFTSAGGTNFETAGDTHPRFQVKQSGIAAWGTGAAATDTTLQRSSAGILTQTAGLDGNTYDTARLILEASGQTVNSLGGVVPTGYVPVTGWGGISLGTGTYHIRGKVQVTPGGAAGGVLMTFTGSGGLAASAMSLDFIEFALPSGGGAASFGNANRIVALSSVFTGAAFGAANREITFDGTVIVSTAGTFTPQVACQTAGTDTWQVKAGSYIEILPVVA